MSTCNRLYYVSKVCLRLLRKYTNEIYPNDTSKIERFAAKKRSSDGEDRNDTQICNFDEIIICNILRENLMEIGGFSDGVTQTTGSTKQKMMRHMMSSSLDATTSSSQKKLPGENLHLAECVGDVRALLIDILCDEIALSVESEGYDSTMEILDECHTTFLSCFNAFYPTNTLKWNCLCDLLMKKDKVRNSTEIICNMFLMSIFNFNFDLQGIMHARLLSAILAGLCNTNVKLKSTFPLLSTNRENMVN